MDAGQPALPKLRDVRNRTVRMDEWFVSHYKAFVRTKHVYSISFNMSQETLLKAV